MDTKKYPKYPKCPKCGEKMYKGEEFFECPKCGYSIRHSLPKKGLYYLWGGLFLCICSGIGMIIICSANLDALLFCFAFVGVVLGLGLMYHSLFILSGK